MDYKRIIGSVVVIVLATIVFIRISKELKKIENGVNKRSLTIMLVMLYLMSIIYTISIIVKK